MAHISLIFIGLMCVIPFLYSHHKYPIPTFYQEWLAALLGLCAMPILVTNRFWSHASIPRIELLPVGMLLLLLAQFALGRIIHFDQAVLFAGYFLWAALLIMLGRHLRDEIDLPQIATTLSLFLLAGTEMSALVGILQHFRWHTFLDAVVMTKVSHVVYGNIAQPNHFASYITFGLISLGLLFARKTLRTWHVAILATPLLFVLALSGSRSSWLFLLWIPCVVLLMQRRDKSMLSLLRYYSLLLLAFGLMHFVVKIPWLAGTGAGVTSLDRLFGEANNGSIRLALLRESWLIFSQFPLLGTGFGQFAWQHFQLDIASHAPNINVIFNNAHNIVAQIATESGIAGMLILLGTTARWLWQVREAQHSIYHLWGYAILSVLAIHSMLEYPLWYAYFIGLAAILLGALDNTTLSLQLRNKGRIIVALALTLGALSIIQLFQSYKKLENVLAMRPLAAIDNRYLLPMHDTLVEMHSHLLLSSYAELYISSMSEVSSDHLLGMLMLNERAMRFMPIASVAYRQAWLLALAGQQDKAMNQLDHAIWAFPYSFLSAQAELTALAKKDPAHFSALQEYAAKKNAITNNTQIPIQSLSPRGSN